MEKIDTKERVWLYFMVWSLFLTTPSSCDNEWHKTHDSFNNQATQLTEINDRLRKLETALLPTKTDKDKTNKDKTNNYPFLYILEK